MTDSAQEIGLKSSGLRVDTDRMSIRSRDEDGTMYQVGKSWYVDIYIQGERVRKSAGRSKVDAERLLEELRTAKVMRRSWYPLRDALQAYEHKARVTGKAKSVKQVELHARTLQRVLGRDFNVATMRPSDVDHFSRFRTAEGVSRATINGSLRILRAAVNRAWEEGDLERVPCKVRLLREPKRLPSILPNGKFEELLGVAASEQARLALLFARYAGLRHREILHLTWDDLVDGMVRVTAKPEAGWSPKSHCEREIPMHDRIAEALDEKAPEGRWLFKGYEGGPRNNLFEDMRKTWEAAGLYDREARSGLHMLRRTWATALAGVTDLETLRQLGGWADLVTVQRYLSSTDDRKRDAIRNL